LGHRASDLQPAAESLGPGAKRKGLLSWSSGKDSAWSLHALRQRDDIEIAGLLTTISAGYDRVAMHAVRRELLQRQAEAAAVPLWSVDLPVPCSDAQYESIMAGVLRRARQAGIEAVAFGDLFLEDIRAYRESRMAGSGLELLFPLWRRHTGELAREMLAGGLRAVVTCVDPRVLDASFAGRDWDETFLHDLPPGIDPCGENGEFHTFVYDGPMLSRAIAIRRGEVVERDGFVFADLLPA
jgi:uncharacterized protein (TIGR00290 family)